MSYAISQEERERTENNFSYHAPSIGQAERYTGLRSAVKDLAYIILENCPPSRERSLALTRLEEVMFWMNASIARNET